MTQGPIQNARNIPFNVRQGSIPNMRDAMLDWWQAMIFVKVTKKTVVGKVVETAEPVNFQGTPPMPHKPTSLQIRMQGERKWKWFNLLSEPQLKLNVDDIIIYRREQYRVMDYNDFRLNGFMEYFIIQDYIGSGPANLVTDNEKKLVFETDGSVVTT